MRWLDVVVMREVLVVLCAVVAQGDEVSNCCLEQSGFSFLGISECVVLNHTGTLACALLGDG